LVTLAVDGWDITFGTARRGLGGLRPRPVPSSLYGQCTNFILFDVPLRSKGLSNCPRPLRNDNVTQC